MLHNKALVGNWGIGVEVMAILAKFLDVWGHIIVKDVSRGKLINPIKILGFKFLKLYPMAYLAGYDRKIQVIFN